MYKPFEPWPAFMLTLRFLWLQVFLACVLAAVFTFMSFVKNRDQNVSGSRTSWLTGKFTSLLSFAYLGVVLAYFLANGLVKNTKEPNVLLSTLGATLIPAITAGIALLENAKTADNDRARSGMAVFLISSILCYQTFAFQIQHFYVD